MPLYEYECAQCHRRTEKIQKFSDPELTICPHCGGPLHRTITAPAFQFAGGGWYKDLYSSTKPAASGESSASKSDSAKPAESTSVPKADAAPASSSAPAPASSAPSAPSKS